MKTITEKIIEKFETIISDQHDPNTRSRMQSALEDIKAVIEQANFDEVSLLLIKYLCENHHPHVTIIITPTHAELLEGLKSTGEVTKYIRD